MSTRHLMAFALVLVTGFGGVRAAEEEQGVIGIMIGHDKDTGKTVVMSVIENSPAAKGGLKDGDVIVKVGDKEPTTVPETVDAIRSYKPGDKVKIVVRRGGEDKTLEVTVGKRPDTLPGM